MSKINPQNFKLKQCKPEDIPGCVKLFFDVFASEPFNFQITEENMQRYLTDISKVPNFRGYLYFMDEKLVGMCFGVCLNYFSSDTYDIKEIAIDKELQGAGVGSLFLGAIEADLEILDIAFITLATQRELPSFKFYTKNGYAVSEGTVYMNKILKD
jgi:aminoglycoside 6'-N-acetyltransferase I